MKADGELKKGISLDVTPSDNGNSKPLDQMFARMKTVVESEGKSINL